VHSRWRRFLPKRKQPVVVLDDGNRLSTIRSFDEANTFIERLKVQGEPREREAKKEYYRTLVIAQSPRAASAQNQMDRHKHGYHNREKRLYELIDFNDAFVSCVLATPHAELPGLAERLRTETNRFCARLGVESFTPDQYEAIVRGLSREIAVYRGALHQGFDVRMTSRTEDAFGIDMFITDRQTGKQLNVDCKTPSAFRHRMEDLVQFGKITDDELIRADEEDFLVHERKKGNETVLVTLLCVRPETLGDIKDFTFVDGTEALGTLLRTIFSRVA
jgi:hypothetical protein